MTNQNGIYGQGQPKEDVAINNARIQGLLLRVFDGLFDMREAATEFIQQVRRKYVIDFDDESFHNKYMELENQIIQANSLRNEAGTVLQHVAQDHGGWSSLREFLAVPRDMYGQSKCACHPAPDAPIEDTPIGIVDERLKAMENHIEQMRQVVETQGKTISTLSSTVGGMQAQRGRWVEDLKRIDEQLDDVRTREAADRGRISWLEDESKEIKRQAERANEFIDQPVLHVEHKLEGRLEKIESDIADIYNQKADSEELNVRQAEVLEVAAKQINIHLRMHKFEQARDRLERMVKEAESRAVPDEELVKQCRKELDELNEVAVALMRDIVDMNEPKGEEEND